MRDTAERVSRASDVLGGRSYERGPVLAAERMGPLPPEQMSINPVAPDEAGTPESRAVNFPTLTAAKERKIR